MRQCPRWSKPKRRGMGKIRIPPGWRALDRPVSSTRHRPGLRGPAARAALQSQTFCDEIETSVPTVVICSWRFAGALTRDDRADQVQVRDFDGDRPPATRVRPFVFAIVILAGCSEGEGPATDVVRNHGGPPETVERPEPVKVPRTCLDNPRLLARLENTTALQSGSRRHDGTTEFFKASDPETTPGCEGGLTRSRRTADGQ